MPHLDPDRLTLVALSELSPAPAETAHLADCATCRDDLAAFRDIAARGRRAVDVRDLPAPDPRVWSRVAAAVAPAPAVERESNRRWRLVLVAAVAVLLGVAGTVAAQRLGARSPSPGRVIAEAELAPQPGAPAGAHGVAKIIDAGGGPQLQITLTGMPTPAGYYAVWLYDGTAMVPLGSPGTAPLNVPAAADLRRFAIVDVSAQAVGQQAHGVSMLQGRLHP